MDLLTKEESPPGATNETLIQIQRKLIRDLIEDDKFDEIGRLPGFSVVRQRNTFEGRPVNCVVYTFGIHKYGDREVIDSEGFAEEIARRFIKESPQVPVAQTGDIVVYGDERKPLKHIGKAVDEKTVESKFGFYSPVFRHPVEMVSSAYGDKIKIHRPSESTQKLLPRSEPYFFVNKF